LNETKTECVKPECNNREVLDFNGKCIECDEYTGPILQDGERCGGRCEACFPTGRDILLKNGKCQECPDYYRISEDRRTCSAVPCTGNSFVTKDGFCTPCPDYTQVDDERRQCVATEC